jgi:tripartite-type tricarboxylate transporter receptor subunit TctC
MKDPEFAKKAEAAGLRLSYMDPADTLAYWKQMEKDVKPLIALAR